jgi:hypothetical protein
VVAVSYQLIFYNKAAARNEFPLDNQQESAKWISKK